MYDNLYLHGIEDSEANNVMCYPRWCEQSFKPMEKTRPK
ncbi:CACNB4 isoform 34 [Pan troglodytes]|uniref:Calcium voltage-gated channel auxiliary subunit beta 4 n=3 Tax=Hominidae TaxID=9604 RepID=A0A1B0GW81_HUMAN|nr:CACNB4 isoform 34 [Pan troglodytes]PNJ53427.1 CACNB4 isoform 36 [Pongo abelii]